MNRIDNRRKREELDALWNDILQDFPNNTIISKGYAIESEVEMHSILFVGMNPSFSANKWNYTKSLHICKKDSAFLLACLDVQPRQQLDVQVYLIKNPPRHLLDAYQ